MLIPPLVVLIPDRFRIDRDWKSILYGFLIGGTACGGQVALFKVATMGPAFLIFPILALAPLVTILMSLAFLRERTGKAGCVGVVLAVVSIVLFSIQKPEGGVHSYMWLIWTLAIMAAWGVQAYYMKVANNHMSSASICFYTSVTAILLIPVALWMTDSHQPINWGFRGPGIAAIVQMLNAIGFCTSVLAFRYGKAIIVTPLCNAYPLITVLLTLVLQRQLPTLLQGVAIVTCLVAATLMVIDEQEETKPLSLEVMPTPQTELETTVKERL
jgi:drug/metabolite transporter (DMT)-like permease